MDFKELLQLFKMRQFEKVIEESKEVEDFNAYFLRIRSFIALGQNEDALKEYDDKRFDIETNDLLSSMKLYIEILVSLNFPYNKILESCTRFYDFPYVNLETEEFISKLPNSIFEMIENKKRNETDIIAKNTIDIDEIINSTDCNFIYESLLEINKNDTQKTYQILPKINGYLKEQNEFDLKYGIFLEELIICNYKASLNFRKNGEYFFALNPSKFYQKYINQLSQFKENLRIINECNSDITLIELTIRYATMCIPYVIPDFLDTQLKMNAYFVACFKIASKNMCAKTNADSLFITLNCDKSDIEKYEKNIEGALIQYNQTLS